MMRETLANCVASSLRNTITQSHALSETPKFVLRDQVASLEKREGAVVCLERLGRNHWTYVCKQRPSDDNSKNPFEILDLGLNRNPLASFFEFMKSHVIPEGYPDSVAPSYTPYMQWRALQYFFGGAMGVFTTRSLLHAVGASRVGSASSAVAVNWAIKDGAGRIGKMLFARYGKKFDCDLKQLRFSGDLLMQLGAGVELATMAAPHLFLPLACTANVAKNVAAVSSTSTRAPIYKAFALNENIGDVTAKGECISNIADLLGTGLGIWMSKRSFNPLGIFCMLSCGYIISSYREVRVLQMPTLNRARFGVAVESFLNTGHVPSLPECNKREPILLWPWAKQKPLELGVRVCNAYSTPNELFKFQGLFQKENYLVTYHQAKRRAFVVLKEKAKSDDILQAAFHAHLLMHLLHRWQSFEKKTIVDRVVTGKGAHLSSRDTEKLLLEGMDRAMVESCKQSPALFDAFKQQARAQGWIIAESLLNPGDARVCI
ncbi:hypothetical protein O6H91_02G005800 [Diphasiastrum complanatum]|nr:hypothetical protein O6H91_02G005800 [Diphasiastrum complanatum]